MRREADRHELRAVRNARDLRPLLLAGLLAGLAASLGAQSPPAGQRGGTIVGVVLSIDAPPQPVRRAIVSLSGGALSSHVSVVADDRGRFIFADLPPGRYTVRASKAAHLTTTYGATRPGQPGTAIAVAAGQQTDIRIVLPRGAVITGTIRDLLGQPAAGVQVTIAAAHEMDRAGDFRPSSETLVTDDRGRYRAYGLAPGQYVISATGRVLGAGEIFMPTTEQVEARLRALADSQPAAGAALGPLALPPGNRDQAYGYAPTFYPGTTVAADAVRVPVAAGEVREGIDVALAPVRAARIAGTIASHEVDVRRLRPTLTRLGPPQPLSQAPRLNGPDADGAFSYTGVTPGRYIVMAQTGPGALMAVSPDATSATTNNPDVPSRFAMEELSVDGTDVTGLLLTLRPAVSLSGRLVFDAASLEPPETLKGLRVSLTTARGGTTILNGLSLGPGPAPAATTADDGTFTLTGIVPGTYGIASAVPKGGPAGWWLRSAIVNGRDVLDHPLEVDATTSDIRGAVLTFTDRRSELAGTLTTATGAPASEFIVVVFPADPSFWRPGARRLRSTRPGSDGAFSVGTLPSGDYLIAALTDVDPDEWQQPDFLRQLVAASVRVAIREGEVTRQDLRIAR